MSAPKSVATALEAMSHCRRAVLTIHGPTDGGFGVTRIVSDAGVIERPWTRKSTPSTARVALYSQFRIKDRRVVTARVSCRQKAGESIEQLLWRALGELAKRERHGMPKRKPTDERRRQARRLMEMPAKGRPS